MTALERYYAPPPWCERPSMSGVYQDLAVVARRGARAIRGRAWDLRARPFQHLTFGKLGDAVQRFVPGPTWSYVPPRDRPRHPTTGCVCRASYVVGMLHTERCPARWSHEPWRTGGAWG